MAQKQRKNPDKTLEQIANITNDDLVELDLYDLVLTQVDHKYFEKKDVINKFLEECKKEIQRQMKNSSGQSYSDKTKKNIEQGALIGYVNKRMEQRADVDFTNNYKHRNLY